MRARIRQVTVLAAVVLVAGAAIAHHMADGIVDDEVYAMISELVADTPHATMDDIPAPVGATDTLLTMLNVPSLERMIDDGLLDFIAMLDGDVTITIVFTDRGGVEMDVLQQE